ncbi:unnamed protein product [Lasius platythorax]|uniref:Uncharacterized protein n=2 Tax=Lasius TaxID=488720 RepID=A0A0J7KAQ5_LASNI|nr:hypothetical protein RF55_13364 [Lasius niger]
MSSKLSQLIVEQTNTIALLARVLINFKKLAKVNVTVSKTQGRLSDLKELWNKIQALHNRICYLATADEKKDQPYFSNEHFYDAEGA